jgi:hypothetical protein
VEKIGCVRIEGREGRVVCVGIVGFVGIFGCVRIVGRVGRVGCVGIGGFDVVFVVGVLEFGVMIRYD